jgi:hypothetical protein
MNTHLRHEARGVLHHRGRSAELRLDYGHPERFEFRSGDEHVRRFVQYAEAVLRHHPTVDAQRC